MDKIDELILNWEERHKNISTKPIKKQQGLPTWGRFVIITLILLVVCSVVFYVITPSEAFTYYMAEGLKAAAGVTLYFIQTFGVALVLVLFALGTKPYLPVIEFNVKHVDKPESHYWRPRSYDVFDDLVVIETWHHDIFKFNVGNMKKLGNRIYLINEIVKTVQKDESILLESEQLEVYRSVVDKKKIEFLSEKLAEAFTLSRNIGYQKASSEVAGALKKLDEGA